MDISIRWSSRKSVCLMTSKLYRIHLGAGPHLLYSLFSHPSIKPSNLLIDAVSLSLMNGSTIDFTTELIGSSFKVAHNPQAKGSGCGCGVSWELKD
jgi:hypothetical protein